MQLKIACPQKLPGTVLQLKASYCITLCIFTVHTNTSLNITQLLSFVVDPITFFQEHALEDAE